MIKNGNCGIKNNNNNRQKHKKLIEDKSDKLCITWLTENIV